jgi:hypothetical protein
MSRRTMIIMVVLAIASMLAYALRETIDRTVIQPVIMLFWVLGIYYDSIPQALIWIILVGLVILIMIGSFGTGSQLVDGRRVSRRPLQGGVESLAGWFLRAPRGLYYKWLLAQRLGKLARELVAFNARQTAPSAHEALNGPGWDPPREVGAYLESGLNGSFADYPRPRRWRKPFQPLPPTPLDLDPARAIDYIESKMEKD